MQFARSVGTEAYFPRDISGDERYERIRHQAGQPIARTRTVSLIEAEAFVDPIGLEREERQHLEPGRVFTRADHRRVCTGIVLRVDYGPPERQITSDWLNTIEGQPVEEVRVRLRWMRVCDHCIMSHDRVVHGSERPVGHQDAVRSTGKVWSNTTAPDIDCCYEERPTESSGRHYELPHHLLWCMEQLVQCLTSSHVYITAGLFGYSAAMMCGRRFLSENGGQLPRKISKHLCAVFSGSYHEIC